MPEVKNSPSTNESTFQVISISKEDKRTRILRRGDLVRIKKIQENRLKSHDGALGRVTKSIPINEKIQKSGDERHDSIDQHPFLYDIDFVLGGKISKCHRRELLYTTAEAEGMISDGKFSRSKRKRKPSSIYADSEIDTKKSPKAKSTAKKKTSKKDDDKDRAESRKTRVEKTSKKRKNATNPAKKISNNSKANSNDDPLENDAIISKDLYEKHRKDFDRSLTRLEKIDHFGFFIEELYYVKCEPSIIPIESSVCKSKEITKNPKLESPDHADAQSPKSSINPSTSISSTSESLNIPPSSPDHVKSSEGEQLSAQPDTFSTPPLNWQHIKDRRDLGRYDLDRLSKFERERKKRLGPYKWEKRKRREQYGKEGLKKEAWCENNVISKPKPKPIGKRNLIRNGVRVHPRVLHPKGINWELFRFDVLEMCNLAISNDPNGIEGGSGTLGHAAKKTMQLLEQIYERTAKKHFQEMDFADARHEFTVLLQAQSNEEAAFQGDWRKTPFPERKYERLKSDVLCAGLSTLDEKISSYEKETVLLDSFVGLSYSYNDTGESEGWMKSVTNKSNEKKTLSIGLSEEQKAADALARDDGVVKAQVRSTMQRLLIAVQDRVMTEGGVLKQPELRSANWEEPSNKNTENSKNFCSELTTNTDMSPHLIEQSVWGIDCYTRKNILICIEKDLDPETAVEFVEKWLLPAINVCPKEIAHDLTNAAKILEGVPLEIDDNLIRDSTAKDRAENWSQSLFGKALLNKINNSGPVWLKAAAFQLRRAIKSLGHDFFRVHPKGHGSIVLSPILKANTLVTFYRGEVYPSWRWGEKMDGIEITQKYIGLRPNLPDFYNMALERPQSDPKGYGLMIVDASRKAGHGSMLSHSCDPTCEVRVAASNGKLCLAMTTLRDVELGEELTFDYNAITESLEEYRSAVCLCGYNKCRGSFLHFATADCYQQVLNRNSPIGVRFANLVKGCTKKVMAEDDEQTLLRHGFGTAAFGAVSFNSGSNMTSSNISDSMDNVPVWLRTYVCDVLRYIEYERRALPISLLCDHFKNDKKDIQDSTECKNISESNNRDKTLPRAKPENNFQYFIRKNKRRFLEELGEKAVKKMKGMEIQQAIRKLGSSEWRLFSDEEKGYWKRKAIKAWKKQQIKHIENGNTSLKESKSVESSSKNNITGKSERAITEGQKEEKRDTLNLSKISFEAADAEGASAMEQRIQQLTQTLSRIGRVLYRHRERITCENNVDRHSIHTPLSIMTDKEVVSWMWCDKKGLVASLFETIKSEKCVGSELYDSLLKVKEEYKPLIEFATSSNQCSISSIEARKLLTKALLELREYLQDGVQKLAKDYRQFELEKSRYKAKARREEAKEKITKEVQATLRNIVDEIVKQNNEQEIVEGTSELQSNQIDGLNKPTMTPRLDHYQNRWKLEAISDILLLNARTSTFFKIVPYSHLESTPIEVYARELGNDVPRSKIIDRDNGGIVESSNIQLVSELVQQEKEHFEKKDKNNTKLSGCNKIKKTKSCIIKGSCDPDEVVAKVNIHYTGDYVISQLLQWFNGGIGQEEGLPDLVGCVILPSLKNIMEGEKTNLGGRGKKTTVYRSKIRPLLFDWLRDPKERGNAFSGELAKAFEGPKLLPREKELELPPLGSPVLDLLIMGDDTNINLTLAALDEDRTYDLSVNVGDHSTANKLESTIDEAMPAQAVAKWVQCEREGCLKWRRLPFYVDLDLLPEKFYCEDNVWNPEANTCDAPEDTWDENDTHLQNDGVAKASDAEMISYDDKAKENEKEFFDLSGFKIGERFDVLRSGKETYCTGEIIDTDLKATVPKAKFHFPKMKEKFDEWIKIPSDRVAPLFTRQLEKEEKSTVREKSNLPVTGSQSSSESAKKEASKNKLQQSKEKKKAKYSSLSAEPSTVAATLLALRRSDTNDSEDHEVKSKSTDEPSHKDSVKYPSESIKKKKRKRLVLFNTDSEDESSSTNEEEIKNINRKKRKQVETLPYVSTSIKVGKEVIIQGNLSDEKSKTHIKTQDSNTSVQIPKRKKNEIVKEEDNISGVKTKTHIETQDLNTLAQIPKKKRNEDPKSAGNRIPRKSSSSKISDKKLLSEQQSLKLQSDIEIRIAKKKYDSKLLLQRNFSKDAKSHNKDGKEKHYSSSFSDETKRLISSQRNDGKLPKPASPHVKKTHESNHTVTSSLHHRKKNPPTKVEKNLPLFFKNRKKQFQGSSDGEEFIPSSSLAHKNKEIFEEGKKQIPRKKTKMYQSKLDRFLIHDSIQSDKHNPTSSPNSLTPQRNKMLRNNARREMPTPKVENHYSQRKDSYSQESYGNKYNNYTFPPPQRNFPPKEQREVQKESYHQNDDHRRMMQREHKRVNSEAFNNNVNDFEYQKQDIVKRRFSKFSNDSSNVYYHREQKPNSQYFSSKDTYFTPPDERLHEEPQNLPYPQGDNRVEKETNYSDLSHFHCAEKIKSREYRTGARPTSLMRESWRQGGDDQEFIKAQSKSFHRQDHTQNFRDRSKSYHDSTYHPQQTHDRASGKYNNLYLEKQRQSDSSPKSFRNKFLNSEDRHCNEEFERRQHNRAEVTKGRHPLLGKRFIPKQR